MKNFILLLCSLALFPTYIYSQNTAPFQYEDEKKILLDVNAEEKLLDKDWYCYEMLYLEKEVQNRKPLRFFLKINDDQTFVQDRKNGNWQIENDLLVFKIESNDYSKDKIFMAGAFSVYKLSEDELILVKNLSSSDKNKIVYYLNTTFLTLPNSYFNDRNPPTPNFLEEYLKKRSLLSKLEIPFSKLEFANKMKDAYLARNLPLPEKPFSEWTLEELDKKWRKLKSK